MKNKYFLAKTLPIVLSAALACVASNAIANNTVFGEGRAPAGAGDSSSIRNIAKQDAMRDAVIKAIKDATALDASDPRYAPLVSEIAKQLRDVQVTEERREGTDFVTRIEVTVDRKQIKNAIRGTELDKSKDRSFSILMLVDEFVTSSRDLNLPLKEVVDFKYDAGTSYSDKSLKASGSSASSKSAVASSSNVNAAAASSARVNGNSSASLAARSSDTYGSDSVAASQRNSFNGQAATAASYNSKENYAAAATSQSSKASIDQKNVNAKNHETVTFHKLVEYQDTSKPTSKSMFLTAFSGNLRDYDLRLMDSSITRSKFFGDKPITLSALSNGAQMAKFAEFARKANADFLMVGSSTVIGGERSPVTGEMTCVVSTEIKAFSASTSEEIGAAAESMQSSGMNIEACAASASTKVADLLAPVFANRTLGYWADRAARGRQFTVELKGSGLPLPMRLAFARALRDIQGAADVEKKEDGDSGVKVTLTLKGKADAMDEVYAAVSSQPAFAGRTLDGKAEGENITLCMNKCAGDVATKEQPAKAKKK